MLDEVIAPSEVHAYVATAAHRVPGFAAIVAQYRQRFERDVIVVAEPVFIIYGEIAVDASADLLALGAHGDRFRYLEHAVLEDADVAVKPEDALVGARQRRQAEQDKCKESLHSTVPNFASGTLAASSDERWKNSRCENRNSDATILLGTLSIIVL